MKHIWFAAMMVVILPERAVSASDNDERARASFTEGVTAFDAGNVSDALVLFEQAYALRPSFKILFNIAQAQAEVGFTEKAIRTFEKYLEDGGDAISEERRTKVEAEIVRLRAKAIAENPPPPKGATATADDSTLALETNVSPKSTHFLFDIGPFVSAGVAATTLTIGAVLGAKSASLNTRLGKACTDGVCPSSYSDDIDSMRKKAVTADVMFVLTSVFTATALSLFVIGRKRSGRTP
jgi:tetratricopeptide (TPR) repeat protein